MNTPNVLLNNQISQPIFIEARTYQFAFDDIHSPLHGYKFTTTKVPFDIGREFVNQVARTQKPLLGGFPAR